MAITQADIDALDRAIASGVLTVRHGDSLVTYQSAAEMWKTRDRLKTELVPASAATARPSTTLTVFRRG